MNETPIEVWKCGGGTQSCAIAALIIQGRLPKPTVSLIVDTGREKQSTWDYYENILYPNLISVGVKLYRVDGLKYKTVDLWSKNEETLLIPAFTSETPRGGKFSNFCSDEWKTRVGDRFLRLEHGIRKSRNWLGFSIDEPRRWIKKENDPLIRLPLVKDVPLTRQGSIKLVESMGWPTPPRSACWMCPNQQDLEWEETKKPSRRIFPRRRLGKGSPKNRPKLLASLLPATIRNCSFQTYQQNGTRLRLGKLLCMNVLIGCENGVD